jgi:hypothetical protein
MVCFDLRDLCLNTYMYVYIYIYIYSGLISCRLLDGARAGYVAADGSRAIVHCAAPYCAASHAASAHKRAPLSQVRW